ncbi:serine hydrolase domain-containing protein [Lyngbya aestuarii]|uniref:serine hydrolase domain-containing protein n=1 Tax=Lyngbya aestuarii TaxID=118322 RepID=UPI0009F8C2E3|nr:serine hydrolase domain-containing protein [Lyngbya aestuarii]
MNNFKLKRLFYAKHWRRLTRFLVCAVTALILVLSYSSVLAAIPIAQNSQNQVPLLSPEPQKSTPKPQTVPPTSNTLTNPEEIANFFDERFNEQMDKQHIPGGVVSLVKDGSIIFEKGYGYANVEEEIPVQADQTLFRVASLSKLFTDTAVLQLYEQGSLELDVDVNQYLKTFQIDSNFEEPVTLSNLMTQTDGTSQRLLGIAANSPEKMLPLEEFLPQRMPPFVWPPGELYTYSNMGISLAGYIVESVSGVPFTEYIDQNILQPLSMPNSSFQQPLPENLAPNLAVSYQYKKGEFKPLPFLYLNIAPAAALSATATDMAHFMIAHLQNGRYENTRILEPETVELMHQQQFTHHPKLPGTGYGFHERVTNNLRVIGHAGNMIGSSSNLSLIPEENVGLFIAFNKYSPVAPGKIVEQFLKRYFPNSNASVNPEKIDLGDDIERFAGTYRDVEYPRDTFAKLTAPFGHVHVKVNENNSLRIETPGLFFPGKVLAKELIPVEPLLFKRADSDGYSAFGEDEQGKITYLFNPIGTKIGAFKKVSSSATIVFQLWMAGICVLIFLSAVLVGLRTVIKGKLSPASGLAMAVSLLYIIFLVGFGLAFWLIAPWKLAYGTPIIIKALLFIPAIAAILSLGLPFFTLKVCQTKEWSNFGKWHYSLTTLAALLFIPVLLYWNVMSPISF